MAGSLLFGTNWKMTFTPSEAREYLMELKLMLADVAARSVFVLPSFPALQTAAEVLAGSVIDWGAQDVYPVDRGAFTGQVSAPMLADLGCTYVMAGHYERRRDLGESDADVKAKVEAVQRWQMTALVCVGEFDQLPRSEARRFVDDQLNVLRDADPARLVIAYEPGWAIGQDGVPASPDWIEAMHAGIRDTLGTLFTAGPTVPIICGGSVELGSARLLLNRPNVDGLFVGRSALVPRSFSEIIHAYPADTARAS